MSRDFHRPGRRINAAGQLILTEPYRHYPGLAEMPTSKLTAIRWGAGALGVGAQGYREQCAQDELDRRAPKTASLCFDVKKGWQPIVG